MASKLCDFPSGPLDFYRQKASFNWKKMKIFTQTEEDVLFMNEICNIVENHPQFQNLSAVENLDETRYKTAMQCLALKKIIDSFSFRNNLEDYKKIVIILKTVGFFRSTVSGKHYIGIEVFKKVIETQGTERHFNYIKRIEDGEIYGAFSMTEIAHGSNTKALQTTATYDKEKQEFILNTPNFEAAKCWAGGLGQTASHVLLFAQLYVNGVHYGVHIFIVPIRDSKFLPYPGVTVGDMGEKIGLHGIDNGFLIFDNYRISRENLLNKFCDVSIDGEYTSDFKNPKIMHEIILGSLFSGRIYLSIGSEGYGVKALTIAIRYAAVRKQFGPNGDEVSILEYQLHQHRLIPYLAAAYAILFSLKFLRETVADFTFQDYSNQNQELIDTATEIHAIASGVKPLITWVTRDTIQECREACGGHGYLKAAGFEELRSENDAVCTLEGDNHILIQQTSHWLIKVWSKIEKGQNISTPLKSANFLSNTFEILKHKFQKDNIHDPLEIIKAHQWLVCYLLKQTKDKITQLTSKEGKFWAVNNSQVFYAKNLTFAFTQHFFLQRMLIKISEATEIGIKNVLLKLFSLYGLWTLEKFLPTFYEGRYIEDPEATFFIHEAILKLCSDLKDDAVSLIDVIAPPDFALNSVLGASDGQVYKRLQAAIFNRPYSMSRPSWWQEIVEESKKIKSKL